MLDKATLGVLLVLFCITPVLAQWEIEEGGDTDPLRSRPTAMAASLYDTERRLVWEYTCFRSKGSGRYIRRP